MKAIYPFSDMQVGDVREVSTRRSRKAVYSAGWEYAKKHTNTDGSRPKFSVSMLEGSTVFLSHYRIERTA